MKKRLEFLEKLESIPESQRVYVDKSGREEFYQRERGQAFRGIKVEDTCRGRKFECTNVIAAKCNGRILAPKAYKHAANKGFFLDWHEHDLLSLVPGADTR